MKPRLNVHYFQHIAQEGFGSCEQYLKQKGATISATEFFALPPDFQLELEALPSIHDVDLLIIMGGDMSVNDEANYPWLKIEKRWIRRYLAAGKPAIGLCLGGQLIATSLGAAVSRNPEQELGWSKVYRMPQLPETCFQVPHELEIMQWHSETFALPKGAIHLMHNPVCRNQMYQLGKNVLGFQFHPEITAKTVKLYLEDTHELSAFSGPYVQDYAELLHVPAEKYYGGQLLLERAIDYVLAQTEDSTAQAEHTIFSSN